MHAEVGCYLCFSPVIAQTASVDISWSYPGPTAESVIPPFCQLMLHCSAERQNAFLLLLFLFFHPSHLSLCSPPPRLFCSSLSSRTMRTLLMRSRLAACRPARKKWQLRMTVTWSHMRPRRWWQVNNFPRLLKPFLPHLLTAVLIEYAAWCSGSLMSLFMTDVHQRVNMTFVPWQKSEHLTICTFVWNVLVL